ncbi:MAG: ABC transporter ATP-binding protein [Deltaproteobacteria bacterium]|nr:MAG: ABC transporter ATP-binding protein [Deltaproteobacteria bacterium]
MEPIIEVENLAIEFATDIGAVKPVQGISYELRKGEVLGVVGESGCGKTVSTMALIGLIQAPGKIVGGSIKFRGTDITHYSQKQWNQLRGKEIAMIFQDPMTSLNPFLTIGDQIREVLELHTDLRGKAIRHRIVELLESVGLESPGNRLSAYPHQFSGGMRQRVMIAMALAAEPKVLLADEPTTALDVTIQAQILDLLASLQEQRELSILMITHDMGIVAGFCDRVQVMYAGRIVERGDVEPLYERPLHPYTEGLLGSIPRLDQPIEALQGIPGQPPSLLHPPDGCLFAPRCNYATDLCRKERPTLEAVKEIEVACYHHALERKA